MMRYILRQRTRTLILHNGHSATCYKCRGTLRLGDVVEVTHRAKMYHADCYDRMHY
jgi:hypothetical protein